ncbi:hypothetical protein [Cellvibrio sp.]|uniref:hypothetical protein n=1 Tax=Cellvibrio sp. TaxID=1965322 RepID=UPI00396481EC
MMLKLFGSLSNFFAVILFTSAAYAQDPVAEKKTPAAEAEAKKEAPSPAKKNDLTDAKAQPAKKMVQDATINLQTTITGNQEQPRVLYILPWQSPQTADVDFEPLDNQQKAVFGHVEREELRRELESAGELQ